MPYEHYSTFSFRHERGVLFVTIDNPPINLMTIEMAMDITRLAEEVSADDATKVIVFNSANPDYFIAHFDVTVLAQFPDKAAPKPTQLDGMANALEIFRTMPKVSIAMIEGRARGGGSEFALALDMRFAALNKAILGQPEISVGILPGGGGTQRLPRLIGRSRALEVILGGADFSAEIAERYGYINRALPATELKPFVDDLAFRIASWSTDAIALNKQSVLNAEKPDIIDGLLEETFLFGKLAALPDAKKRMNKVLEFGGQTYEGELDFEAIEKRLQEFFVE